MMSLLDRIGQDWVLAILPSAKSCQGRREWQDGRGARAAELGHRERAAGPTVNRRPWPTPHLGGRPTTAPRQVGPQRLDGERRIERAPLGTLPADAPRGMEFLYSPNRLNVATSRVKCVCVLVGSPAVFEAECRTPRHMQLANAYCRYLEMATII